MERTFDAVPSRDVRNSQFTIRTLVAPQVRKRKLWEGPTPRLDQGREGACVGFAWTTEAMASPMRVKFPDGNAAARSVYLEAQRIDEWPGENYEGTSVLAGAKVMQSRGLIVSYRWAETMDEVVDAIIAEGPVVVGIPWYSGMYDTDDRGKVQVFGQLVGGHAITLTGYTPKWWGTEWFRWRNSWGRTYGVGGDAWIRRDDLEGLLHEWHDAGMPLEACLPLGRRLP